MSENAVLLDTHVLLWLTSGSDRLAETAGLAAIEKARLTGDLHLSIMSIWEIGMLASKDRIRLRKETRAWVDSTIAELGLRIHPITLGIATESSRLPGDIHNDPADQILIATARELDAPIITADAAIVAYSHSGYVKAIEV